MKTAMLSSQFFLSKPSVHCVLPFMLQAAAVAQARFTVDHYPEEPAAQATLEVIIGIEK